MWGLEHTAMAGAAISLAIVLLFSGASDRFLSIRVLLITQFPFWAGSLVWFTFGIKAPVEINLVTDLIVGFALIGLAHSIGRDFLAWLSMLFFGASSLDALASIISFPLYIYLHEVIHYAALVIIWSRAHVDIFRRHARDLLGIKEGS